MQRCRLSLTLQSVVKLFSHLKMSDLSTRGFFTSFLGFNNFLHEHFLNPREHFRGELLRSFRVFRYGLSTTKQLNEDNL